MPPDSLAAVLRRIHRVIDRHDAGEDGRLLERFAARRDEAAFEALVRRLGPLVRAAARRVLPDANDADDVFQAAFLVLACKADSLRSSRCLAAWLHRTATRLALALREDAVRRRRRERKAAAPRAADPSAESVWRDLRPVLDAEILRLPDRYRLPLVLCCLQEKTHEQAARELGCPRGSVAGRLARARELLRARLVRRGVTLSAAALSALFIEKAAHAAAPAALIGATVQMGCAFSRTGAAMIAGKGAAMAQAALHGSLAVRVAVGTALILIVAAATAAGLAVRQPPPTPPPAAARTAAHDAEEPKPAHTDLLGDPLPDGAEVRLGTVRLRHSSFVMAAVFSADGKTLYAAEDKEGMVQWDVETGRSLGRIAAGTYCYSGATTPDRTRLVADNGMDGSKEGTFLLWDVKADKQIRRFGKFNPNGIRALAISADGKTLASSTEHIQKQASTHNIVLWDAESGQELRRVDDIPGFIHALYFTPDGKELVSAGDGGVRVWGVESGKKRLEFIQASRARVSRDGKTLAAVCDDHSVRLIDLADGKDRCRITGRKGGPVAFTPDSRFLVGADGDGDFIFWDSETGKESRRFSGSAGQPWNLSFSPDGRTLAIGCFDHSIRLFDVQTGKERNAYTGHRGAVVVAFSPDGKTAATAAGDGTVRLWDPRTGEHRQLLRDHKDNVLCMAFSPDGKLLATGGGPPVGGGEGDFVIRLWDPQTGQVVRRLEGHEGPVGTMAFSPDGRLLAAGGEEVYAAHLNNLRLWDVATGKVVRRFDDTNGTTNGALTVAFSLDGTTVAEGRRSGPLQLWSAADGKLVREVSDGQLLHRSENCYRCVAFSPDGKRVVAGLGRRGGALDNREENAMQSWDAATGELLSRPPVNDAISALAFSRDGAVLAVASEDNSVYLIDALTGREFRRFTGHQGTVRGLAFAPDGQTLLSGSEDGTALIWDVTGRRADGKLPPVRLTSEQLAARWDELADPDPAKAQPALWELVAGAEASVPFLDKNLAPVTPPDPARLARVLADLNDDDFEVRDRASAELERFGEGAVPAVRKALETSPPPEARRRLEQALERVSGSAPSGPQSRLLRAVEVLEHVGSPAARALLKRLAGGVSDAGLTRAAKAALERLPP